MKNGIPLRLIPKSTLRPVERGRRNNKIAWPDGHKPTSEEVKVFKKIRTKKRRAYIKDEVPGI